MSKCYKCDACGKTIENAYKEHMKEFFVGAKFDLGLVLPECVCSTRRIHLCEQCYHSLDKLRKEVKHSGIK